MILMLQTDRKSKNTALLSGHLTFDVSHHPQAQSEVAKSMICSTRIGHEDVCRSRKHGFGAAIALLARLRLRGVGDGSDGCQDGGG